MDPIAVLRLLIRYVHLIAAMAWVGGSLFYLLVLVPAWRDAPVVEAARGAIQRRFREVVEVSILVLLITGAVMTVDRLTSGLATTAYALVLALKIAASLWMFALGLEIRRRFRPKRPARPRPRWLSGPYLVLELGLVVFFLAVLLRALYGAGNN